MTKTLEFSLTVQEDTVLIDGASYVLVELDGRGRDRYLNDLSNRLKIDKDGKASGLKTFEGVQANLIAACLFKVGADGRRTPVTVETIQSWPARVCIGLYTAAQELCGLDVKAVDVGNG